MSSPSDAPVRAAGTRTRSGNAMARTRTAILLAAVRSVEEVGLRGTTMSRVASTSRVAKATLYNHFRTKDDLLDALVLWKIGELLATVRGVELEAGLHALAAELAALPAVRRIAEGEPAVLPVLVRPGDGRLWTAARTAVTTLLEQAGVVAGPPAVELVLRWLAAHLLGGAESAELTLAARLLAGSLLAAPPPAPAQPPAHAAAMSGVGWA